MNKIKEAFDNVCAEEKLKQDTISFLTERNHRRISKGYYRYASAAAAFLIFAGIGGYKMMWESVSYIAIDVNPSVRLSLNRLNTVVEAAAYNDDGEAILDNINLKGKRCADAIDTLLSDDVFSSYVNNEDVIDFTVVSDNSEKIIEEIQGCKGYGKYKSECAEADSQTAAEADSCGLSLGKYRAYLEISKHNSDITPEDCRNMTMRQLDEMLGAYSDGETLHRGNNSSGHGKHERKHKNNK